MSRRRERGSGTIFESPKGSGIWWARLPADGTGTPRKWRVESKEAGRKLLKEKLRELDDGVQIRERTQTVDAWMKHWLKNVLRVKATTLEGYQDVVRINITPHLGSIKLEALTRAQVRAWLNMLSEKLAPNTVRNAFVLLKAALQLAADDQLIKRNPCDGAKVPRKGGEMEDADEEIAHVALTADEVARLLEVARGHRLYALYYIASVTGMRQAELIGLRWQDVTLDNKEPVIRVRQTIRLVNGKATALTPKSKKSKRDIPIDGNVVEVLREHRAALGEEIVRMGDEWRDSGLVFPSEVGTPLLARNLVRQFKALLVRAELPKATRFHDLRHTAGSLMLAAGIPLIDVSVTLGHSSVAVTASVYSHAFESGKRKAIASVTDQIKR